MTRNSRASSKLFLSADLVGSTQYKQTTPGWQKIFLSFYREFPQLVAKENYREAADQSLDFELWKAVGDELIFQVPITSERQISRAVRVWLSAMEAYEQEVLIESKLALKGGAFIGTFPGPDSESTIPKNPNVEDSDDSVVLLNQKALRGQRTPKKYLYDYFGPSIDTGFRIAGMATQRFFPMSVEVAWSIALAAADASHTKAGEEQHHVHDVVFRGTHALKGVWKGREYPVFAIDRECDDAVHAAIGNLNGGELSSQSIIDVCHACHESGGWPSRLYLPDSTHETFQAEPEDVMSGMGEVEGGMAGAETIDTSDGGASLEKDPPMGAAVPEPELVR